MLIGNLFIRAVSLSVSGSLIALAIFAISPKIKLKLSSAWQYYIWLAVILRMILPHAPKVSLMGGFYRLLEKNGQILDTAASISANPAFETVMGYAGIIWLAIAVLLIAKRVIGYIAYTRVISSNCSEVTNADIKRIFIQVCDDMNIEKSVGLYCCKEINCPMLIGFFRPCVVLPKAMLQKMDGLKYIFVHELTHYKRKDFLYKWLIQIIACVHFYNPVVHLVKRKINDYCEFSCDESVIRHLDNHGKKAYGSALIDALEINSGLKQHTAVSLMLCDDIKRIKDRLDAIKVHRPVSKAQAAVMGALTCAVCLATVHVGVLSNVFVKCACLCLERSMNLIA